MAFDFSKLTSLVRKDIAKSEGRSVIGVDVGSSSIKVVQLHDNKGVATLDTYGELQLGPYAGVAIGRVTNLNAAKLAEAFVDIIRESSATAKDVALAISYNSSFTTIISVPAKGEELASRIPIEARKYIPVSLNEVSLDWFPISARSNDTSTKVFLVAIHNNALDRYEVIIRTAELNKRSTELEIFSLIRSCVAQEDKTVALIDLGASSTKLYIADRGVVTRTHSVRMGGSELTSAIVTTLSQEYKEAEELKRKVGLHGLENDPRVQKSMTSILERALRELHTVMKRHADEEGVPIDKVIISGGGAMLQGIENYASDMLGQKITIADPFSKVAYPAFLEDTLKEAGPTFGVAVGAALRVVMSGEG